MGGEIGEPFESVNIMDTTANPGIREAVKQFSSWPTIPQLFVQGELVGGADIISELHTKGTLQEQLKSAVAGGAAAAEGAATGAATATAERGEVALIDDPSRPTASQMSKVLSESFDLYGLRIVDESSMHEGDAGALEMGLK